MQVLNLLVHNSWESLSMIRYFNPTMLGFLSFNDDNVRDVVEIGAVYSMWDGSISSLKRDVGSQTTVVCIPNPKNFLLDLEFLKKLADKGRAIILYKDYAYDPVTKKWTNNPNVIPFNEEGVL